MATTLTASTEAQLDADIAEANAAASGSFVIALEANVTETADFTAIDLQAGVTLTVDGSNGGGSFTLDGAGSFDGISVDVGGVGSSVTIGNLDIAGVPSVDPAVLSGGTLSGAVTILSNAVVDQTADLTFGDTSGPATVTNDGTYEIDQLGTNAPAINGVVGSLLVNEGTIVKLENPDDNSGVSEFYVDITDSGTLAVPDPNSNLRFDGANNSFSGTYIGGGMVDYGDPVEFQALGYSNYSVSALGTIDMSQSACTTSWAYVNQNGEITASSSTTISNYGTWNFTSDNGIMLENPSEASTSISEFALYTTGILAKTGGTGTTVIGIDFNEYGGAFSNQGGTITIASGTLAFDGLIGNFYSAVSGSGIFSLGGGGGDSLYNGTSITSSGWTITGAGTNVTLNVLLSYSGVFTEQSGATLTLTPSNYLTLSNATFDGTVTGDSSAGIVLASGGTLEIDDLASFASESQTQNFNAPIMGFSSGDTLRLEGFGEFVTINGTSASYDAGTNTTSLTLTDIDSTVATLDLAGGNYTAATVIPDPTIEGAVDVVLICFCVNTQILTPSGERPVQDLVVGDEVLTHGGEARRITWIGIGKVPAARGRRNGATPVIVRRGALADNVPNRDLHVTKGHSLYLDGALIPVEYLVNHRSIVWDDYAQEVSLYHIELETHDILIANDAPVESYRDDGNRGLFQNANTAWNLPQLEPYAPILTGGPLVDAVWHRLLGRVHPEPRSPLTDDADLHLLVDGQRVAVKRWFGETHIFRLLAQPASVRIVSRAAAPQELGVARDPRIIGVAVRQVAVTQGWRLKLIEADDPSLTDGFHGFEPDNGFRWTNGDAAVPMALFEGLDGPIEVHLRVGQTTLYAAEVRRARQHEPSAGMRSNMVDDPHDEVLEADTDEIQDRRRRNRRDVSEELIPLLRNPTGGGSFAIDDATPPDMDETTPSDDMSAARGFIVGAFVGTLIWIGIVLGLVRMAGPWVMGCSPP